MLLSKTAYVKWNSKIKNRYVDLGYLYTRMGDMFEVDVKDLSKGSSAIVSVRCDYCGKVCEKKWYSYLAEHDNPSVDKDCCNSCKKHKIEEVALKKYGVNSVLRLDSVKTRIADTNMMIYGAENVFASDAIKRKIQETNLLKYGYTSAMKSKETQKKASDTCMRKYGVPYYISLQCNRGTASPRWKGGVAYHRVERATSEYIEWRMAVYARDMYTCQCCGIHSGKGMPVRLNAHHIKNWKDNPDSRYLVDNGITLCSKCHYSFHSIYGKSNNTSEQLDEFLISHGKKVC